MSTKRQTTIKGEKSGHQPLPEHQQHPMGPNKSWKVRDGRSKTATSPPRTPRLGLQSGQSFKGLDLIGGGEVNIFNSSSVSLLFLKILGGYLQSLVWFGSSKRKMCNHVCEVGGRGEGSAQELNEVIQNGQHQSQLCAQTGTCSALMAAVRDRIWHIALGLMLSKAPATCLHTGSAKTDLIILMWTGQLTLVIHHCFPKQLLFSEELVFCFVCFLIAIIRATFCQCQRHSARQVICMCV